MKLAVVGTGNIVKKFLYGVSKSEGLVCDAVCSRREETAQHFIETCDSLTEGQVRIFTDYEALLADPQISLIYVGLPNSLHYDYTKRALLAGKNVICEKPFTVTAAETKELSELAKNRRLFLFEAITTRNLPNYRLIREKLPALGRIRMVQCNFSQYSSRYDEYLAGGNPNVFNPEYAGGAWNDLNIYNLHFVMGLFGKPESGIYRANFGANGIDVSGAALLTYDGFQAVCVAAKDSASPNFAMIQGEKGYLLVDGQTSRCPRVTVCAGGQTETFGEDQTEENVLTYEVAVFEKIMQANDYEACSRKLAESVEVMEVLEELREAER